MRTEYDFSKGRRGAVVPMSPGKTRIAIHLDNNVLDWFRQQVHAAGGGDLEALIDQALRDFIEHRGERLEETLRRVLREEFPADRTTKTPRSVRLGKGVQPSRRGARRSRQTAKASG